jgi:hypothetical protein
MQLETSQDLLNRVRAKQNSSWYGLARLLSTHKNTVYNWKGGHTIIDRKFAPRIAELLGESPEYVLACLEADREQDAEVLKVWHRIAAKFRSNAASILLVGLGLMTVPRESAASVLDVVLVGELSNPHSIHYAHLRRRRAKVRAWLKSRVLAPLLSRWATERSTAIQPSAWPSSPALI